MGHEDLELDPLDENCLPTGTTVSVVERGKWLHIVVPPFKIDAQGKPSITASGDTSNTMKARQTVVVFEFQGYTGIAGKFCSISAKFYSDKEKTNDVTGQYFGQHTHYGGWNLVYPLISDLPIATAVTLYYSLHFSDPNTNMTGDWDPSLRLEPRSPT